MPGHPRARPAPVPAASTEPATVVLATPPAAATRPAPPTHATLPLPACPKSANLQAAFAGGMTHQAHRAGASRHRLHPSLRLIDAGAGLELTPSARSFSDRRQPKDMVALCRLSPLLFPGVSDLKIWHRELSSSSFVLHVWESYLPGSSNWTSFVIKHDSY